MKRTQGQFAFTLVELLVVISIIAIIGVIGVATMGDLFSRGAEAKVQNIIDAQLRVARGLAVRDRRYTGVHFQPSYRRTDEYWVAIVQQQDFDMADPNDRPRGLIDINVDPLPNGPDVVYDPKEPSQMGHAFFGVVEGTQPKRLPNGTGVCRDEDLADIPGSAAPLDEKMRYFTTFTILFAPDGRLLTNTIDIQPRFVLFEDVSKGQFFTDPVFAEQQYDPNDPKNPIPRPNWRIWDPNSPQVNTRCVRAVRIYDANELGRLQSAARRDMFLRQYCRHLPIAPYVGGLLSVGRTTGGGG